jgi:glycosyltransferase involved in cell wall biosynthesis
MSASHRPEGGPATGARDAGFDSRRADVVIVSDLRFPGGNASSTLEELDTFSGAGLRVLAVHCPANISGDHPISERYARHQARCLAAAEVGQLTADTLIVRHPAVVCADGFPALSKRIDARRIAVVVNNSMFRARGEPAYDPWELSRRVRALEAEVCRLFPIGPLVREELERFMPPPRPHWLGPFDWTPTFDLRNIAFQPRSSMSPPFTIGRHGRDSAEKWLEDADALRRAYPASGDFRIEILGGADGARQLLGRLPGNWRVTAFGGESPEAYLGRLDAFVYFPHTGLREAFGRGIVEAVGAGVPCILPEQLRPAFDDLAFFCTPAEVAGVVRRLAEDDAMRQRFAEQARLIVERRYGSNGLFLRLAQLEALADTPDFAPLGPCGGLPPELAAYRERVVSGPVPTK